MPSHPLSRGKEANSLTGDIVDRCETCDQSDSKLNCRTHSPIQELTSQLFKALVTNVDSETTSDGNWQASKNNVRERNAAMFRNELMSDIVFVVGSQQTSQLRIPAHKYVLATSSSVFYAMFYGSLADNKQEIEIPDIEPNAFLTMLRYLYCDEIRIEEESILSLLYCAKKYLLPQLSRLCVQYLESNLTHENACLLLSQSRLFDEGELVERCFEVIDAQAELALASDGFLDIDHDTLTQIASRETLHVKEVSLQIKFPSIKYDFPKDNNI